ncbi:MAG TPA: TonB-dependent receptor [Gemmatimonadales bacterium]|nr:TonB-dependent receptor [Gemmatimonadales bacterium]
MTRRGTVGWLVLMVGGLALRPAAGAAQAPADSVELEEVVVTATRLPTSLDAVTAGVTVIPGEELRRRGVRFVADALRDVPGAAVVQGGSYGGVSSLFLRGGESDYVKVLVDGVPVNEPGGAYDFANLTTDNVERIEIVRGPASVLYGADAVSGVVHVLTRRGAGRPALTAQVEGGTYGTVRWDAGFAGGGPTVDYSIGLARFTSDGIYAFNNTYRNTVASGRLRARPDALTDATLTLRYGDSRSSFPTDFAGVPSDSNQFTFGNAFTVGIDAGRRLAPWLEARVSLAAHDADGGFDDRPDHPGDNTGFGFQERRFATLLRRSADGRVNLRPRADLVVTAGAQLELEDGRSFSESVSDFGGGPDTSATSFEADRRTLGYYAQAVYRPATGLALNLNGRVDDSDAFSTFVSWRAGAAYLLPTGTRVRGAFGRGFRAPTFAELFANSPFEVGNPDLDPERATSWELGLEQHLMDDRLRLAATYFDQRFRDMIQYQGAAPGEPNYRNVAEAWARGVEVEAELALLGRRLTGAASYTYLETEVTEDGGTASPAFAQGEALLRRPGHSARLGLTARPMGAVTLAANLTRVGSRADVDFAAFPARRLTLPAYTIVDLAAEAELTAPIGRLPGFTLGGRVENLFDEDYQQVYGFKSRGRAVFVGVGMRW